ncbi:MAG: phosphotransferase [Patescibacteria group bacterium]
MDVRKKYQALIDRSPVNHALDLRFVYRIIREVAKKNFPELATIKRIRHAVHKRRVGETKSTFIYSCFIDGTDVTGEKISKHLIYSAHTDGSRLTAYTNMSLLCEHGFNATPFKMITPLAYLPDIQALIYEAVDGKTLLQYMQSGIPSPTLRHLTHLAALWIRKFHTFKLPKEVMERFPVFDMLEVNPRIERVLTEVRSADASQAEKLQAFIATFQTVESSLAPEVTPGLVYGDYHPENIITEDLRTKDLTVIDFTDVNRGDQLRDIGSFIQQLHFMGRECYPVAEVDEQRQYFVAEYFGRSLDKLTTAEFQRVNLYQAWNSLRGFTWFFFNPTMRQQSYGLLEDAWLYLSLARDSEHTINIKT